MDQEKILSIIRQAGDIILNAEDIRSSVEVKEGHANFVTAYDKKVQAFLKEKLAEVMPEAVFVGEEDDQAHASIRSGYAFIVDPIDGTTNFMRGMSRSAVSVGLLCDGEQIFGAVYNPYHKEMFTAQKGKGAFCNGKPIQVSGRPLSDGLVIAGTAPYYREELGNKTFDLIHSYFDRCLDIRRSGSAALDLCDIACGRAEVFFELRLSPWDYAAGSLIVTEAGGRVTTAEGERLVFDHPISVLASGCRDEK